MINQKQQELVSFDDSEKEYSLTKFQKQIKELVLTFSQLLELEIKFQKAKFYVMDMLLKMENLLLEEILK